MQAGCFATFDRSQILDQLVLDGPLPAWVEESIRFVDRHSARAAIINGPRRRDVSAVPAVAVREAIVNAVVHADYSQPGGPLRVALFSDHLEIENSGLLPFALTIDEIQGNSSHTPDFSCDLLGFRVGLSGWNLLRMACRFVGCVGLW